MTQAICQWNANLAHEKLLADWYKRSEHLGSARLLPLVAGVENTMKSISLCRYLRYKANRSMWNISKPLTLLVLTEVLHLEKGHNSKNTRERQYKVRVRSFQAVKGTYEIEKCDTSLTKTQNETPTL